MKGIKVWLVMGLLLICAVQVHAAVVSLDVTYYKGTIVNYFGTVDVDNPASEWDDMYYYAKPTSSQNWYLKAEEHFYDSRPGPHVYFYSKYINMSGNGTYTGLQESPQMGVQFITL